LVRSAAQAARRPRGPDARHRHIDWIGECGGIPILSAPSPVMEVTDDAATCFYIHTLAVGPDRRLRLLRPQRVTVEGEPRAR
jgi:hypothetical protein